jgi:tRNA (cmo5U34)-methyltransferase
MSAFADPVAVARYAENPPRLVPGFHAMQRMAAILLAETVPPEGAVLVLGAGGGLELAAFAGWHPGWRFTGVDPSAPMLDLARAATVAVADRVRLLQGVIDDAPPGPFDGATCLLTLHFLPRAERLATLVALRARLRPGAALVVAQHSFPPDPALAAPWMARFAGFAIASGIDPAMARRAAESLPVQLPVLSPEDDEDLLRQAGFTGVALFYAAFSFRGWVGFAP